MNVHLAQPIGVFDSGLGGLSVVRQLRAVLPRESILYAADSHFCPYGERSLDEIRSRSLTMVGHLVESGAKMVIVACNTASAASIEVLRATFPIPIVAMEPAVKPAVPLTVTGKIAVFATPNTARSARLHNLISRYGAGLDIRAVAVPGLADRVEAGETDGPNVRSLLVDLISAQVGDGVDVIVLGCTHYPFASAVVENIAGPDVRIIDSGNAVARRARDVLMTRGELAGIGVCSTLSMVTTGALDAVQRITAKLLGENVQLTRLASHTPVAVQV